MAAWQHTPWESDWVGDCTTGRRVHSVPRRLLRRTAAPASHTDLPEVATAPASSSGAATSPCPHARTGTRSAHGRERVRTRAVINRG